VYRKLEVTSRTQLATLVNGDARERAPPAG